MSSQATLMLATKSFRSDLIAHIVPNLPSAESSPVSYYSRILNSYTQLFYVAHCNYIIPPVSGPTKNSCKLSIANNVVVEGGGKVRGGKGCEKNRIGTNGELGQNSLDTRRRGSGTLSAGLLVHFFKAEECGNWRFPEEF